VEHGAHFLILYYPPRSPLLASLGAAVQRSVRRFDPHGLNNAAWAFASLRHHPGGALLDAVGAQCGLQV
jgi:hypothetical protein